MLPVVTVEEALKIPFGLAEYGWESRVIWKLLNEGPVGP